MSSNVNPAKVFIGGLSWETSDQKLRAYFENFGAVVEAFVSYDRATGRPRGFGFVVFESTEVADKVVASKHTIDRREVR
jgi:RNA recognition motif-containing protein